MKEAKKPNATLIAFEKLRDSAVENLCKALRAGMRTHEKDIVKALIFSVSNRLYTQDKAKDAQLMSQNTILTLGHIAVALRHEEKVTLILIETFCIRNHFRKLPAGGGEHSDVLPAKVLSKHQQPGHGQADCGPVGLYGHRQDRQ